MVVPGTIFEEFGFNYVGPIDGHDLDSLIPTLENLRDLKGPQFLHVVTKKGQGYKLAEADPVTYHGPGQVRSGGRPASSRRRRRSRPSRRCSASGCATWPSRTSAWSASRRRCAKARAWSSSRSAFPKRYYDVGIAEQHAVTFAAGLACEGLKPVVAIYSTFLQRGYDQLIHDVAIQNLPVVFALDRAGLVGADGATHAGAYDIAYLRCVPNMSVLAPADENECRKALSTAFRAGPSGGGALSARRGRRRGGRAGPRPRCRAARARSRSRAAATARSRSWPSAPCCIRRCRRPSGSMRRWSTCASSSRSTSRWC